MTYPSRWGAVARIGVLAALMCVLAVALGACGSSDSKSESSSAASGGSDGVSEQDLARYDKRLQDLYRGTYTEPTGSAVQVPSGKNVWVVVSGMDVESAQNVAKGVKEAGAGLKWKVNVVDGKFDSTKQLAGIEQALADNADGIILAYIDCAAVKNGLKSAQDKGVPTIAIEGLDCKPALFAHSVMYAGDQDYLEWTKGWGAAQAAWVIAKTRGEAKAVVNTQTDIASTRETVKGVREELAKCPTCEVAGDAAFVGADFGPPLQQKISQQFVQHPDANAFIAAYDAALTTGGSAALKATGRLDDIKVMGGEGSVALIKAIRDGTVGGCIGLDTGQEAYGAVDSLGRILADQDPSKSNSGIGWQLCDEDNNMPAEGKAYQPPVDYRTIYKKLWGVS